MASAVVQGFIQKARSERLKGGYVTPLSNSAAVCCRRLLLKLNAGMVFPVPKIPLRPLRRLPRPFLIPTERRAYFPSNRRDPVAGTTTPVADATKRVPRTPFYFDTGYALFAKRASRPFPPPFLSKPSVSFSDPLTTHHQSRDRRPYVNGEMIRGVTNGDDAVLVEENFIGANDGVGAWASREKGHAA